MQRTVSLTLLTICMIAVNAPMLSQAADLSASFSSPSDLAKLVPELRDADGTFRIPDPGKDVAKFLRVHHALINVVEAALVKAAVKSELSEISKYQSMSLTFPQKWRSAEIGISTDGKRAGFPDGGHFASYGGESFLSGIVAVPNTHASFYQVLKPDRTCPAIIYSEATIIPSVNRLVLAAANTGGTWQTPSYALGNANGEAWLIINKCVDVALSGSVNGQTVLIPNAELFTAIHWADSDALAHMRTQQTGHDHH